MAETRYDNNFNLKGWKISLKGEKSISIHFFNGLALSITKQDELTFLLHNKFIAKTERH